MVALIAKNPLLQVRPKIRSSQKVFDFLVSSERILPGFGSVVKAPARAGPSVDSQESYTCAHAVLWENFLAIFTPRSHVCAPFWAKIFCGFVGGVDS